MLSIIVQEPVHPQSIGKTKIESGAITREKGFLIMLGLAIGIGIIVMGIALIILLPMFLTDDRGKATSSMTQIITTTTTVVYHPDNSTIISDYSSALTNNSKTFVRNTNFGMYYYESIEVTVPISGNYTFTSVSTTDTYGYLYDNIFDPFNRCSNLITENDDADDYTVQFQIEYLLQSGINYTLVVTTFVPYDTAPFLIIASGPSTVIFIDMSDISTGIPPEPLISSNEVVYDTIVGQNSNAAQIGSCFGCYPAAESPNQALDNNTNTKYLNFGSCEPSDNNYICGLNTGFYLTLQRGTSMVIGLQVCTGNDNENRDPITVTLEGSNQSDGDLILGSSWSLIYNGSSGIFDGLPRSTCGVTRFFCNSIEYMSYRFLITDKRSSDNSVQYSEVQLFGY